MKNVYIAIGDHSGGTKNQVTENLAFMATRTFKKKLPTFYRPKKAVSMIDEPNNCTLYPFNSVITVFDKTRLREIGQETHYILRFPIVVSLVFVWLGAI